ARDAGVVLRAHGRGIPRAPRSHAQDPRRDRLRGGTGRGGVLRDGRHRSPRARRRPRGREAHGRGGRRRGRAGLVVLLRGLTGCASRAVRVPEEARDARGRRRTHARPRALTYSRAGIELVMRGARKDTRLGLIILSILLMASATGCDRADSSNPESPL